ncbi:hypothetical protein GX586_12335 [bacterium]|nr:hypothetical protein [bacterium]
MNLLSGVERDAKALLDRAARMAGALPAASVIAVRLGRALELAAGADGARPATIVLLGGTGVGKSALFNALIRVPGASPEHVTRAHTDRLYVAADPADRHALGFLDEARDVFIPSPAHGLALVDAPDIDSVKWHEHRAVTRAAVEACDVAVYITSPDKVANFTVNEEVREWASRKRWFFVMNRMDEVPGALEAKRGEFDRRLAQLGFAPDDSVRFMVSAQQADGDEFNRLARAVFSARTVAQVQALHINTALGAVRHAVADDVMAPLRAAHSRLAADERALEQRVQAVLADGLSTPRVTDALERVMRETVWMQLPGRAGWLLAIPVWLRCRVYAVMSAFALGRMATGAASLARLVRAGWYAVMAALRGAMPLHVLLSGFSQEHLRQLQAVRNDAARAVEDAGLGSLLRDEHGPAGDDAPSIGEALAAVPVIGHSISRLIAAGTARDTVRGQVLPLVEAAVAACAQDAARRAVGPAVSLIGNALPTVVLGQTAWRVFSAWQNGRWLPFEFYLSAAMMLVLSVLPGYLLVAARVRSSAVAPDVAAVAAAVAAPAETRVLSGVAAQINGFITAADALRRNAEALRDAVASELAPPAFGAREA